MDLGFDTNSRVVARKRRLHRFVAILGLLILVQDLTPSSALSEKRDEDLTRDYRAQALADSVNLDPDSEAFARLVERLRNPQPIPSRPVVEKRSKPVAHFRKPGAEEIPRISFSRAQRSRPQLQQRGSLLASKSGVSPQFQKGNSSAVVLSREERVEKQLALYTAEPLASCGKGRTKKQKNERMKGRLLYEADPLMDLLVLPQRAPRQGDFVSFSFKEFFGESATVHYFSTKPGDVVSSQLAENGIDCVPARLIVTKENIFVHTGERALRYYEFESLSRGKEKGKKSRKKKKEKKGGKEIMKDGKLHPMIASRLDDFLAEG